MGLRDLSFITMSNLPSAWRVLTDTQVEQRIARDFERAELEKRWHAGAVLELERPWRAAGAGLSDSPSLIEGPSDRQVRALQRLWACGPVARFKQAGMAGLEPAGAAGPAGVWGWSRRLGLERSPWPPALCQGCATPAT